MKRIIAITLTLSLVFAFCACGGKVGSDTGSAAPVDSTEPTEPTEPTESAKSADGTVYNINYATESSTESFRYTKIEKPLMDLITEKSGGRIQFTVYASGSIAAGGTVIESCVDGTCDMGIDMLTFYTGSYLYTELLGTPGINMGNTMEEKIANLNTYAEKYSGPEAEKSVHFVCQFPTLDFYLDTTYEINSMSDLKGRTSQASPTYMDMFTDAGVSVVNIISPELYESFRLNVIDSAFSAIGAIDAFKLYEVSDYAYALPIAFAEQALVMSKSVYEGLPADLQAVIDECAKEIPKFVLDLSEAVYTNVEGSISDGSFEFRDLPEDVLAQLTEICKPIIEAKVAELNAAGLDGDGAIALINSFTN